MRVALITRYRHAVTDLVWREPATTPACLPEARRAARGRLPSSREVEVRGAVGRHQDPGLVGESA